MNIAAFILIMIGVIMLTVAWVKANITCPGPKVIYRTVMPNELDIQFGKDNMPSVIYSDLFTQSSPWIGGFKMGDGKTQKVLRSG